MKKEKTTSDLFDLTMVNDWELVWKRYFEDPKSRTTKLTKTEETALHIAVSHDRSKNYPDAYYIEKMVELVNKDELSMRNNQGNTPLHQAAAVGWVSIIEKMVSKNHELLKMRNNIGETPMFVAAHHGKKLAFLLLYELVNDRTGGEVVEIEHDWVEVEIEGVHEPQDNNHQITLCRNKDGNTILHSAISGDYFDLAYQIIDYYPNLVNCINVDGESPLHVLAKKPNVFKSSSSFGFYDSLVYHCVFVDDLKLLKYESESSQNGHSTPSKVPPHYRACVDIFHLFWDPITTSYIASRQPEFQKQPSDAENQKKAGETKNKTLTRTPFAYPPNYATSVLIFQILMKIILSVLGFGFKRIKKIQMKKERYTHVTVIMNKMIEFEASYAYNDDGKRPFGREPIDFPNNPPLVDESSNSTGEKSSPPNKDQHGNNIDEQQKKPDTSMDDTALIVAAEMGIPEMVKKIIQKCPIAIQDKDSKGKNVLLLAAEHRHASVLDCLLDRNLPDYMFHQLDKDGNGILHLAATLGDHRPWRIPGAALQMQWEIKWYKHVKSKIPQLCYAHHNFNGETPRKIFTQTHRKLVKEGSQWLIKTSESCSVVAALIATVAFASSATVPGGLNQESGVPLLQTRRAFDIFSITSLMALCLAVTALIFFLGIITSRCEERDFKAELPKKLLLGLTALFVSIAVMLISFCAGHTLILRGDVRYAVWPIYMIAGAPVTLFALAQLPLYIDILWAACRKVPLRSYKLFHQ